MSGRYFRNFAVLSKKALSYSSPFDDELAAAAEPVAAAEVGGDAADQDARIAAGRRQQPADQRRRRGLAVGAGDDDRSRRPQELLAHQLGQRAVADLALEHRFEFGVAARDGVADADQAEVAGDVLRLVAVERQDALLAQEGAHRRVDRLVGAAHVPAAHLEHGGDRGHRRAADADEMNAIGHRCSSPLALYRPVRGGFLLVGPGRVSSRRRLLRRPAPPAPARRRWPAPRTAASWWPPACARTGTRPRLVP